MPLEEGHHRLHLVEEIWDSIAAHPEELFLTPAQLKELDRRKRQLLIRRKEGLPLYFLLVSSDGRPVNKQILDMVAEPIEITGEVIRQGELSILRADPAMYRPVGK